MALEKKVNGSSYTEVDRLDKWGVVMINIQNQMKKYIENLVPEIRKRFGNGIVVAHIELEPPVFSVNSGGDLPMVACDLWCEDPPAAYDINILIEDKVNLDVLDTPIVTSLEEAKNLALLIATQVNDYKFHP